MSKKKKDAYMKAAEAIDKAQQSTTPFPVVNEGEISVVGDANETKINKHDFKIRFRVPVKNEDGSVTYAMRTKEYKDVFITPRQDAKIVSVLTKILPYFVKVLNNGEVEKLSFDERLDVLRKFDDDIIDSMYDLTAVVLGVDPELKDYMHLGDAVDASLSILQMYPEVVNEADTFFE